MSSSPTDPDPSYRAPAELGPEHLEALLTRIGDTAVRVQGMLTAFSATAGLAGGVALAAVRLQGSAAIPGVLFLGMLGAGFGVLASHWFQPVILPLVVQRAARTEAKRAGTALGPLLDAARATFL